MELKIENFINKLPRITGISCSVIGGVLGIGYAANNYFDTSEYLFYCLAGSVAGVFVGIFTAYALITGTALYYVCSSIKACVSNNHKNLH